MKLVLVIGGLSFGGAERVITNLANYFASNGDEVTLIAISHKKNVYTIDPRVSIINGVEHKNKLDAIRKLRKLLQNTRPDIVLSFLTHINITTILAGIGTGIPVVISERNDPESMPPERIRKFLRAIIYPLADGIVFQTVQAQRYFNKSIQKKSKVIQNPVFLSAKPQCLEKRRKEIVSVGRLVPQKNHDKIIKAFSKLSNKYKEYTLNIFGEGEQRDYLSKLIQELGLENKIFLHGATTRLHEKIRNAEIFVMASDFEGMPNALMEAMSLGLASISTHCPSGGPAFLIKNMENGILIPVDDEIKLINSMEKLISNESLRIALARESKKIYMNPNIIFSQWKEYLRSKTKKT